jgi:hypothetical protein
MPVSGALSSAVHQLAGADRVGSHEAFRHFAGYLRS